MRADGEMATSDRYSDFLLDMDGVIYLNQEPIPDAVTFIRRLREMGKGILFLTNNSKYTPGEYRIKLSAMGIEASEEEFITSSVATATFLEENYDLEGKTSFCIGGPGLVEALSETRLNPLAGEEGRSADFVVVGWDTELTYDKLRIATLALYSGAVFVATNRDATFPAPDGLWPGAGSIVAALETAAGREALVVGKPNVYMIQAALSRTGGKTDRTLMIGDRLETDIVGGWRAGLDTCLVLSGVAVREDLEGYSPQPDLIVESLLELL
ncbi:MAG: HAD-IIA family hydrolase [Actinobacteria bacterium]|nr:MAG: HAD-IIA family hydrolase [Actinomycetota bacterium]